MFQEATVNLYAGEQGDNFWWKTTPIQKGIIMFCGWKKLFKDYLVNQVLQKLY